MAQKSSRCLKVFRSRFKIKVRSEMAKFVGRHVDANSVPDRPNDLYSNRRLCLGAAAGTHEERAVDVCFQRWHYFLTVPAQPSRDSIRQLDQIVLPSRFRLGSWNLQEDPPARPI